MKSISPNLNIMVKACEKASKILIRDFGEVEKLQVSKKGPRDFVTNADKKVEKILVNELSKKKFSIISEETGTILKEDKNNYWVIDPIDGTTNFLLGIPHFCISIAHINKGEILSGIIMDPIKNEIFYAEKNAGAFFNNQRIRVSKKNIIDDCLFVTNSEGVKFKNINVRVSGSAALDIAYVACGRYDGFYQKKLNIWDVAAGCLILTEAGGIVNQFDTNKIKIPSIIASSEIIYKEFSNLLKNF